MTCEDGFRVKAGAIGMDLAYGQAEYANEKFDQSAEDYKRWVAGAGAATGISIRIPF